MPQILIVDDEKSLRLTLAEFLRREGHSVQTAETADAAKVILGRGGIDLVLADIVLPGASGIELLNWIRERVPETQVIMLTGEPTVETATAAVKSGALDYLTKPIGRSAILRATAQGLRVKELLDAKRRLEETERRQQTELERLVDQRTRSLEESRRFLSDLIEYSGAAVLVKDDLGRYELVNRQWEAITGIPRERALGQTDEQLWPASQARANRESDRRVLAGGQPEAIEEVLSGPDGRRFFSTVKFPVRRPDGQVRGVCAMSTEITERRRIENQLREREAQFRRAQEVAHVGSWSVDLRTSVLTWSEEAYRIFGVPMGTPLQRQDFFQRVHPADLERVRAAWNQALRHHPYDIEHRIVVGDTIRWVHEKAELEFEGEDNAVSAIGTVQDITEKKRVEAQFLRAQRLESIGALAGGIAHDLNNILAPILMAVPLLRGGQASRETEEIIELVEGCARRGADIVRQLLAFSRGSPGERIPVQPRHLVREMAAMLRETFPKSITVQTTAANDLWPVAGDPTQLQQVLLNLCLNARDAMPEGGLLQLGARNVDLDVAPPFMPPDISPGRFVRLEVTDNGQGIPAEILDRIFEPFFTTKEPGKGTGLGLSTVLGIVRGHGGFVNVRSEPGLGASFDVYLPALGESLAREPVSRRAAMPRGNGERVLLVDDEEPLRVSLRNLLERHGYRVSLASQGAEAIAALESGGEEPQALVTDLLMPVADGLALARWVRARRPHLRIVVLSGVMEWGGIADKLEALRGLGVHAILRKPCDATELLTALAEALKSAEAKS